MWSGWIASKSIGNIGIGYKKPGKIAEKMDRQCQRGSYQRGSNVEQVVECVQEKELGEVCPCSSIVGNLRVKMHGSKKVT